MGRWRTIRRWSLRIAVGGVLVVAVLAVIGWNWERSEEAAFREAGVAPPDTTIPVGDQRLRVVVTGQGAPGVLLIAGLGGGPGDWEKVQPRLSESMRVVSYDRPGLGWSPSREGDLTLDAAVADVAGLLAVPGLFDGPPILVGHSLGGQIARHFAYAYPNAVSGLIMIDAPPDGGSGGFLLGLEGAGHAVIAGLARVGVFRWLYYRDHPDLSRDQLRVGAHLNASAHIAGTVHREMKGAMSSRPVEVPPGGLGGLPLTFLLADQPVPGLLRGKMDELNAAKRLIPRESTRGRLIEMKSGHYIQIDHPDVVIAEVLAMSALIDSLRAPEPGPDQRDRP